MKRAISYLLTLLVVCAAGFVIWTVYQRYLAHPWTRDGQVRANVVGIAPRVAGPISHVLVSDNEQVKRGDLLFEIDPADFQADVDNAKAQLLSAEATLKQRSEEMGRQSALAKAKVNAVQDLQNARDNLASSQATAAAATAVLETTELRLSYTKIYAPVDGYITNLNVSDGTYVSAGQQLLALVDTDSFWIAAYFKETQLRHMAPGSRVQITLLGHEDQPFAGIVQSVSWGIFVQDGSSSTSTTLLPSVSPTIDWVRLAQRFPVRIRVQENCPVPLRIGQTASVAVYGLTPAIDSRSEPLAGRSHQQRVSHGSSLKALDSARINQANEFSAADGR
jgi:RND family efflux transporter MFP subunit